MSLRQRRFSPVSRAYPAYYPCLIVTFGLVALAITGAAEADWKDDIGYTQLSVEHGARNHRLSSTRRGG